jgi:hypothetical protein
MKRITIALAVALALGMAGVASAAEGGGSAYKDGAEGLMTGALPPPGQYLLNYTLYYQADDLIDGSGDKVPVDFKLRVLADVVRFVNVTKVDVLGGNWAQHIFVPVVWQNVLVNPTPGGKLRDDQVNIGDIIVDPFIIGWHKPPFHWVVGVDTYIPVGQYDKMEAASIGRNYWTFQPVAAVTYRDNDGIELSAKLMYDFNTENHDTDYLSGQAFHTDFVAAKHFGEQQAWAVGVGGFWFQQTTDDEQSGVKVNNSRSQQVGLGPQVSYQAGPVNISLAYDQEFATKMRPEGGRAWLKIVLPL